MNRILAVGCVLLGMGVCVTRASAQTTVNTDGTSGNWSNPAVWFGGIVPNNGGGNTYGVNILNTPNAVLITLDMDVVVSDLSIASGSFLDADAGYSLGVTGDLVDSGSFYWGSGTAASVGGNLTLGSSGSLFLEGTSTLDISGNVDNLGLVQGGSGPGSLNVGGTFTNEGTLNLGEGEVANINTLNNQGYLLVPLGATLNLTHGLTDIASDALLEDLGTVNGLGDLTRIDGTLVWGNQSLVVTPEGGILTVDGTLGFEGNGVLDVSGNVHNFGYVSVGGFGSQSLNVSGTFVNETGGTLDQSGLSNINALNNHGLVEVGGTLDIAANVDNWADLSYGIVEVDHNLTNEASGTVALGKLQVAGNVDNLGIMSNELGKATLNVGGTFTNGAGATLVLEGGTVASINALNNLGTVTVGSGGTLSLTQGVTGIASGSTLTVGLGGTMNGLAPLTSIEGTLYLGDYQTTGVTPDGGRLTVGSSGSLVVAGSGTTLNVNGLLVDSGSVQVANSATLNLSESMTDLRGYFSDQGTTNALNNLASIEGGLYLENGQTTTITPGDGMLTLTSGYLKVDQASTLDVAGSMNNFGYVNLWSSAPNILSVSGTFTNEVGAHVELDVGGDVANMNTLNNYGSMQVGDYGSLAGVNVSGNVDNSGILFTAGGKLDVGHTFTNESSGELELQYSGDSAQIGQAFANGGLVDVSQQSLLAVGIGTLDSADFRYQQFADGTLDELIHSSSIFGFMGVNGAVSLDGALDVTLGKGFTPTVGETFDIMNFTAGDLTGTWATIGNDVFDHGAEMWAVNYNNSAGEILLEAESHTPAPTPEPAPLILLSTGLVALVFVRRRRAEPNAV